MGSKTSGSFKPGDKRINRKGRPKNFDALRALAQEIAHKELSQKDGSLITVTEAIMQGWAGSKDPRLQLQFIEIAYGKVPSSVEVSGKDGKDMILRVIYGDDGNNDSTT